MCVQRGHFVRECPQRARNAMVSEVPGNNNSTQEESDLSAQFATYGCFMMSQRSTISFPFGDRKALVSIDSNCSRHLVNIQPCSILQKYLDIQFENNKELAGYPTAELELW